jgi:hypothetical protein
MIKIPALPKDDQVITECPQCHSKNILLKRGKGFCMHCSYEGEQGMFTHEY